MPKLTPRQRDILDITLSFMDEYKDCPIIMHYDGVGNDLVALADDIRTAFDIEEN